MHRVRTKKKLPHSMSIYIICVICSSIRTVASTWRPTLEDKLTGVASFDGKDWTFLAGVICSESRSAT